MSQGPHRQFRNNHAFHDGPRRLPHIIMARTVRQVLQQRDTVRPPSIVDWVQLSVLRVADHGSLSCLPAVGILLSEPPWTIKERPTPWGCSLLLRNAYPFAKHRAPAHNGSLGPVRFSSVQLTFLQAILCSKHVACRQTSYKGLSHAAHVPFAVKRHLIFDTSQDITTAQHIAAERAELLDVDLRG